MSADIHIVQIFNNVVKGSACHQKCKKKLKYIYEQDNAEHFITQIMNSLFIVFNMEYSSYTNRFLDFLAKFSAEAYANNNDKDFAFFTDIVTRTLKLHDVTSENVRLHCCKFIGFILKEVSDDGLDDDLCDNIQKVMIERIKDHRMAVRLEAIACLERLQDPQNYECPVIGCYLETMEDVKAQVRCEVTKHLAPSVQHFGKLLDRIRDVSDSVRAVAFARCADIGPNNFCIEDRQKILNSGFAEDCATVKNVFLNNLMVKWLTCFDQNVLKFVKAIKLDACEEDYENTRTLTRHILHVYLRNHPLDQFIEVLELNSRLIPLSALNCEKAVYLDVLVNYLRKQNNGDNVLDEILPELTEFSNYIQDYVNNAFGPNSRDNDAWTILDSEIILSHLLNIMIGYDFSDEFGRSHLQNMIIAILTKHKFDYEVTSRLVLIYDKCCTDLSSFVVKICETISDIREPLIELQPSRKSIEEREFNIAKLRVKVNQLQADIEKAVKVENYCKATELKELLTKATKEFEEMKNVKGHFGRVVNNDVSTTCYSLDILTSLLAIRRVNRMLPGLESLKDDFVINLCQTDSSEIIWRVVKCLILYSIIDVNTAKELAQLFTIPMSTYHTTNYNQKCFIISMKGVCDLIRLYGVETILQDKKNCTTNGKRKLYNQEEVNTTRPVIINFENYIDTLMDMLDDESHDIRDCAVDVLYRLLLNEFHTSFPASVVSRIILKWFNPTQTEMQGKLGMLLQKYASLKTARSIFEECLILTLTSIVVAPRNSPLTDVNIDGVVKFFATVLNMNGVESNRNFAFNICMEINRRPQSGIVPHLCKILTRLEISQVPPNLIHELINEANSTKLEIEGKQARKLMETFIQNLQRTHLNDNAPKECRVILKNLRIPENTTESNEDGMDYTIHDSSPPDSTNQNQSNTLTPSSNDQQKDCCVILENLRILPVRSNLSSSFQNRNSVGNRLSLSSRPILPTDFNNEQSSGSDSE